MSSTMQTSFTKKMSGGKEAWEVTVEINGLQPTKITKSDGTTLFASKSAASQSANSLAKRLGCQIVSPTKIAAKKSVKKN